MGYCLGETQGTVGGIRLYVRDLGNSAVQYRTADSRVLARWPRKYPPKGFQSFSAQTMTASKVKEIAVKPHHERELATAQPHRSLGNRVEHRLDVGRRAGDHVQDLGAGRLLLERLGELARARLHLVEQPHVLDGDDGLVGEGLEQLDLLRTEGPRFGAAHHEGPDDDSLAQQRHADASVQA